MRAGSFCAAMWSGVLWRWCTLFIFSVGTDCYAYCAGDLLCRARTKTTDNCLHFFSASINSNGRPIIHFSSTQFKKVRMKNKLIVGAQQFFSLPVQSGRSKHSEKQTACNFRRINFLCDNFAWILMACFISNKLKKEEKWSRTFFYRFETATTIKNIDLFYQLSLTAFRIS